VTRIRLAAAGDAADIQSIYAPHASSTSVSFEVEEPSVAEIRRRIGSVSARYPWLVCVGPAGVAGYSYACQHRERAAYRWSVDVSVYVREGCQRRGVGGALYSALLDALRDMGYCNAYAGITLPNPGSVALHEKMGFRAVALYTEVGFKLGAWHDVGWWHRALAPHEVPPRLPTEIAAWTGDIGRGGRFRGEGVVIPLEL
jgi:L-amino acid N-acyltransferase YncA